MRNTMDLKLSSEMLVNVVRDQVSTSLGENTVILGLDAGVYYGLNEVGQDVWNLVQQPIRVGQICAKISDLYDVDPAICELDIETLLLDLYRHKLIEIHEH